MSLTVGSALRFGWEAFKLRPWFFIGTGGLGPINAMKESKRIAYGWKWWLLGFFAVLVLVNLLGLIAFAVGLLVSIPVSTLAFVHAYRVLSGKVEPRQADAALAA